MHTELEQKCMLRKKTQAFRGKIKLYGEKTQGKAEKTHVRPGCWLQLAGKAPNKNPRDCKPRT